jgi:hypothetical protein
MQPDHTHPLTTAAAYRHATTIASACQALHELTRADQPITFQAVARTAGVSRQWLYTQPQLRAEIERLRGQPRSTSSVPRRERASDASTRQRIEHLLAENRRLRTENTDLKEELAITYGHQRAAR